MTNLACTAVVAAVAASSLLCGRRERRSAWCAKSMAVCRLLAATVVAIVRLGLLDIGRQLVGWGFEVRLDQIAASCVHTMSPG